MRYQDSHKLFLQIHKNLQVQILKNFYRSIFNYINCIKGDCIIKNHLPIHSSLLSESKKSKMAMVVIEREALHFADIVPLPSKI